jgi:DNA modification methylase
MIRRRSRTSTPSGSAAGAAKQNVGTIKLQIEYRGLGSLVFDQRNPRQHSTKQVRQIADSIREFGFVTPIVADDEGHIVAGGGRYLAAKLLGLSEVPVIALRHLSSAQLKAFKLADNKLAQNAHWDERLLGEAFVELKALDLDFDLEITGFAGPEIDLLIQDLNQSPFPEEEHGSITGVPVCQPGDLWLAGDHRIFCGDATSEDSFQILMDGAFARLIFVDPPYNVAIQGHVSGNGKVRHREFAHASGEMSAETFVRFLARCFGLLVHHSVDGSIHFICIDWRHAKDLQEAGEQVYSELKNINVWAKDKAGMGSLYRSQHEFIFVFKAGAAPHINNIGLGKYRRNRSNVWQYPSASTMARKGDDLLALHPTAKPVTMVMDALLDCSNRGDIVLDSFLGSGTTLMAAERTGRTCHGIELDPLYVDTAIRRWQNLTGCDARRASDNKSFREIEAEKEKRDEKGKN